MRHAADKLFLKKVRRQAEIYTWLEPKVVSRNLFCQFVSVRRLWHYRVSLATNSLCYYLARPTKTAMLRRLAAGSVLLYLLLIYKVLSLSVVVTSGDDVFTKMKSWPISISNRLFRYVERREAPLQLMSFTHKLRNNLADNSKVNVQC